MCRFLVYAGTEPIQLCHLVTRPVHSVTNQTYESRLRFESPRPFNADGFGLGWYEAGSSQESLPLLEDDQGVHGETLQERQRPCIFKSIAPAWSNANLTRLAEKVRSPLVFAHVRASTMPGAPSENDCHPWSFGKLMWMHNGEINGWKRLKRRLLASLPEELFLYPEGHTDSEWAFMLFLSLLRDPHASAFTSQELRTAMFATLAKLNELRREAGVESPSLLNFVVSDGKNVVATRYITSKTLEASSLFFSSGTMFTESGQCKGEYRMMKADKREDTIMIASEPLTFEERDWMEVKTNTMVVITPQMNLLQIPIKDEYYVPPRDNANRSSDFVRAKGFGANSDIKTPLITHPIASY